MAWHPVCTALRHDETHSMPGRDRDRGRMGVPLPAIHRESDRLRDAPVSIPLVGLQVSGSGNSAMLTMKWSF